MTKYIFLLVVSLALLISSCDNKPSAYIEKPKPVKVKNTLVLLYDISISNDEFAYLNESQLADIFSKIAFNGGGKFYSYLIKSDSRNQDVFEYEIPALDTLVLKGNVYQIKRRADANQEKKKRLNICLSDFIAQCKIKLIVDKTEEFTDLANALLLAKTTIQQPNIASTNINLLIISDGINDLPPIDGEDKMTPVDFSNTNIVLVRPTKISFVTGKPTVTNSINDGIINLK